MTSGQKRRFGAFGIGPSAENVGNPRGNVKTMRRGKWPFSDLFSVLDGHIVPKKETMF